jgi:lipid II:glycine glycyltransferase (peptidoglycan interpeptide bridge formation enzyme)
LIRKSIFHEDWWLDALAPGQWREVTYCRGDRVAGYLRFVERREGAMTVCEMPPITRFLGPIVTVPSGKTEARVRSAYSVITELLKHLAAHDHVEMTLDNEFTDLAPFLASGYEVKVHPTFLLDCRRPAEDLWAGLRDKTKNVIRRAREHLTVRDVDDVDQFVSFYKSNLEGAEPYFDLSPLPLAFAAAKARQQCKIVTAIDSSDVVHAQVLFIWDDRYVYYFLSTRDRSVAHLGAVSLLLWTGIELANSRGLYFDFDGGITDDTKYKFKVAFGGELANRFDVARSTARYQLRRTFRRIPRAIVRRISARA